MNTTIAHSLTQAHGGEALRPIVALVAHDGRKQEMIEWATFNRGTLERCTLYATRTTGKGLGAYLEVPAIDYQDLAGPEIEKLRELHGRWT